MDFPSPPVPPSAGIRLTDDQRLDWLRLIRSENVGPRTFRTLVNHYGSARGALAALPDLARRGGASRPGRIVTRAEAEGELEDARRFGVAFVATAEKDYPAWLAALPDPPPLLAVRGHAAALARPMLAIVGSRNASGAGLKFAEMLARGLGAAGFVVVSGLARGIDAAAHRASLPTGTVAVLAGGHDRIYPPEHVALLDQILHSGAAVSEMPMGWEPRARDFPRRNRLIAGLAMGVAVVEAARRSGSLITARLAAENGREVFAVPGSPLDPRAEGTNNLIRQGAALVTSCDDILSVIAPMLERVPEPPLAEPATETDDLGDPGSDERARIVSLLGPTPVSVDDLVRLAAAPVGAVRTVLLELELAGRLQRHGNAMVSLLEPSDFR